LDYNFIGPNPTLTMPQRGIGYEKIRLGFPI